MMLLKVAPDDSQSGSTLCRSLNEVCIRVVEAPQIAQA
jgi:hypothetical protein